ncbi:MAG: hypothetical protein ACK4PR_13825 [Gammaproteobacteria bacterium]
MTGRITTLLQDIEQAILHQPHASPRYAKQRRYILLSLIADLRTINRVIPRLSSLNKNIIQKLIQYWQAQGNSSNTIYHKITVLRNICKHYLADNPIPSQQELGLTYYFGGKTIILDNMAVLEIKHPTIGYLHRLQRYFGLKMIETIKVEPYMFDKEGLWLTRAAAYNNKNRLIPYWCEEQKRLVGELLLDTSMRSSDSALLVMQYKAILKQTGIIDNEYYRYQYIYYRYQHLLTTEQTDYYTILKQLRSDTGYRENRQIKAILKCLNAS